MKTTKFVSPDFAIFAIHGGKIELGTKEVAEMISSDDLSFYSFEGEGFGDHIPSDIYKEEEALSLASKVNTIVSIHGEKNAEESFVMIGGLDKALGLKMARSLLAANFEVREPSTELSGQDPDNICNKGKSGKGVQIEISRKLRKKLWKDEELRQEFVQAIRGVLGKEESLPSEFKDLSYATSTVEDGNLSFIWGNKEKVLNNRKNFLSKYNIKLEDCVGTHLVHKSNFRVVGNEDRGRCMTNTDACFEVDGLITKEKELYLFLLTADCIPLTVYDPKKKVLSLTHVSRINSGAKVVTNLIHFLKSNFNCEPSNLLVYIGPCIHKESYIKTKPGSIDGDRSWDPYVETLDDGREGINLVGYNVDKLLEGGIKEENIFQSPSDTCSTKQYFSHLRSKADKTPEGRFATVVGIKSR